MENGRDPAPDEARYFKADSDGESDDSSTSKKDVRKNSGIPPLRSMLGGSAAENKGINAAPPKLASPESGSLAPFFALEQQRKDRERQRREEAERRAREQVDEDESSAQKKKADKKEAETSVQQTAVESQPQQAATTETADDSAEGVKETTRDSEGQTSAEDDELKQAQEAGEHAASLDDQRAEKSISDGAAADELLLAAQEASRVEAAQEVSSVDTALQYEALQAEPAETMQSRMRAAAEAAEALPPSDARAMVEEALRAAETPVDAESELQGVRRQAEQYADELSAEMAQQETQTPTDDSPQERLSEQIPQPLTGEDYRQPSSSDIDDEPTPTETPPPVPPPLTVDSMPDAGGGGRLPLDTETLDEFGDVPPIDTGADTMPVRGSWGASSSEAVGGGPTFNRAPVVATMESAARPRTPEHSHEHSHPRAMLLGGTALLASHLINKWRTERGDERLRQRMDTFKQTIEQSQAQLADKQRGMQAEAGQAQEANERSHQQFARRLEAVEQQAPAATTVAAMEQQRMGLGAQQAEKVNRARIANELHQRSEQKTGQMAWAERAADRQRVAQEAADVSATEQQKTLGAAERQPQATVEAASLPRPERLRTAPELVGSMNEQLNERSHEVRDDPSASQQAGGSASSVGSILASSSYQRPVQAVSRQMADDQAYLAQGRSYQRPSQDAYKKAMKAGFWGGVAVSLLAALAALL
ncbi:hypothetical protein CR970_01860 [Candidatus Saccharibacteria bacterium]|nr:MAG: hypothetical protein CR970_01860 [Candidatus Saccharibacteria bacterium]